MGVKALPPLNMKLMNTALSSGSSLSCPMKVAVYVASSDYVGKRVLEENVSEPLNRKSKSF